MYSDVGQRVWGYQHSSYGFDGFWGYSGSVAGLSSSTSGLAIVKARNRGLLVAVALAAGIAAVLAVLMTRGAEQGGSASETTQGSPRITGESLAAYERGTRDGAIDRQAPEVRGADFNGRSVEIVKDGRPKVIVFLAHWCPHCQAEVPWVQAWVESGAKPDTIDLYAVPTWIDSGRENYPPDAWLEREGWTSPILVDTDDAVADAFGVRGVPFWVFLKSDGTVALRLSGEISEQELTHISEALR